MSQRCWGSTIATIVVWIFVVSSSGGGGIGFVRASTFGLDVLAMKDLRHGLNIVLNWYDGDPCESDWQGVTCDNSSTRITEVTLINQKLVGSLPSSIGNLTSLQVLDLSLNPSLRGPIPSSIGYLTNLVRLNLQNCGINGTIPREIGSLSKLSFLALNGNDLTGNIPPTLGLLQSLDWCDLSFNDLNGELPVSAGFDNLKVLRHMHLNNNNLSGAIPGSLSAMPRLFHLLLDNNNFTGTIPPELGSLPQLRILRLDHNQLEGPVPEEISRLTTLLGLHLTNNNLNGSFPNLSAVPNLQLIRAGYLSLSSSTLPPWISKMLKLRTLEFTKRNLVGEIRTDLFSLPSLEAVFLDDNRLNGSVNISTASSSLELVSLENNLISGIDRILGAITVRLSGNPACLDAKNNNQNRRYCENDVKMWEPPVDRCNLTCQDHKLLLPTTCSCAYPLVCTIQFITPSFSAITVDRINNVTGQFSSALGISTSQIWIGSVDFTANQRLVMNVLFFPPGKEVYLEPGLVSKIILLLSIQRISVPEFGPMLLMNANQPPTAPQSATKTTRFVFVVTVCVCVGVSAAIAGVCIVFIVVRKKRARKSSHDYGFSSIGELAPKFKGCRWFTLDELTKASDNFSINNLIGVGGYGKVYKGQLLHTGEVVAIKRAEKESMQGLEEFRTEIELFSRLHHKNLVNLIGFCTDSGQQMLVYEFMPNRTLRDHLFERALDWKTRLSIALGSAKGLEYLHELADPPIIHRDIKSSNILLDENLVAKVADLGLSKLAPTCNDDKAYASIQVKGTLGYLDPEYYAYHQLSAKSDVYSYGVVLIEIITGKQPIDNGSFIVKEIKEAVAWGGVASLLSFVDKRLREEVTLEQVQRYFRMALQCVEDSGRDRPKMNDVVKELEEIIKLQEAHETGKGGGADQIGNESKTKNRDGNGNGNGNAIGESSFEVLNPDFCYAWSSDGSEDPGLAFQAFGSLQQQRRE